MHGNPKVKSISKIEGKVYLELTEVEAKALYNMTVYGTKPFLEWFYRNLGKVYLQQHEAGIISLFDTVRNELPQHIEKIDNARKLLK